MTTHYHKKFERVFLRCIEWINIQIVIFSAHDGTYGGHFNDVAIAK